MKESHRMVLNPLLAAAVDGVFMTYEYNSPDADGRSYGRDLMAVIGFSAEGLKGGLAVGVSSYLATQMTPATIADASDWVGEICNQILGRIRNQLLRYGADLSVGTPVVLAGLDICVNASREDTLRYQCPYSGRHRFEGFLDVSFDDGYEFERPNLEAVAANEGSLLMFSEEDAE